MHMLVVKEGKSLLSKNIQGGFYMKLSVLISSDNSLSSPCSVMVSSMTEVGLPSDTNLGRLVEADKRMEPGLTMQGMEVLRDILVPKLDMQAHRGLPEPAQGHLNLSHILMGYTIQSGSLAVSSNTTMGSLKMLLFKGGSHGIREAWDHIVIVEPKDSLTRFMV